MNVAKPQTNPYFGATIMLIELYGSSRYCSETVLKMLSEHLSSRSIEPVLLKINSKNEGGMLSSDCSHSVQLAAKGVEKKELRMRSVPFLRDFLQRICFDPKEQFVITLG
jgi:hypothetical protein